eukprot:CAMPEP_0179842506 /NCGR_PEP_ID=MMETSP0982-20121206/3167_1 /TAXON_ID=483367 /ORGANISM="non described non described, Strain CCMP 2436" /LENGTH=63 /DNA_ID=CAMNT_0021726791 /DNA_START=1055 /DNA_END=1243 /DNA_ORIENTATION=-
MTQASAASSTRPRRAGHARLRRGWGCLPSWAGVPLPEAGGGTLGERRWRVATIQVCRAIRANG